MSIACEPRHPIDAPLSGSLPARGQRSRRLPPAAIAPEGRFAFEA
jgi:hypothetical protein